MNPHNMGLTTRDRLLLAFANLASYGIETFPAVEGDFESARAQLEAECRAAHPDGLLSYVFWLRSDEATLFQQGDLPPGCALPLFYHSRGEIVHAIAAACGDVSIEVVVSVRPGELLVRNSGGSRDTSRRPGAGTM